MPNITVPDDATLVHISVRVRGPGVYDLGVFPSRAGETTAFRPNPLGGGAHDERPRRVVWVAHGLPKNMVLSVRSKPGQTFHPFGPKHEVAGTAAGIAQAIIPGGGCPAGPREKWSYDVFLFKDQAAANAAGNGGAGALASVDPDVDFHPDP